jgi:hypothetical protein
VVIDDATVVDSEDTGDDLDDFRASDQFRAPTRVRKSAPSVSRSGYRLKPFNEHCTPNRDLPFAFPATKERGKPSK